VQAVKRGDLNPEQGLVEHIGPGTSFVKHYKPPAMAVDPEDERVKPISECNAYKAEKSTKAVDTLGNRHVRRIWLLADNNPLMLPHGGRSTNQGKDRSQLGTLSRSSLA
jgi:hypothetical protein